MPVRFGVRCCVHFIDALGQHQHFDQHPQTEDSTQSNDMYDVLQDLAVGNENDAREKVKQNQEQIVNNDTDATFGRRRR
ncbi:MAG: hypothetical protein ACLSUZ_04585 [Bifidobacterium pseudocatenulatum]